MSAYVDEHCTGGRLHLCHLIADSPEELAAMARALRLPEGSAHYPGTRDEHYDITMTQRRQALGRGAIELSNVDLRKITKGRQLADYAGQLVRP